MSPIDDEDADDSVTLDGVQVDLSRLRDELQGVRIAAEAQRPTSRIGVVRAVWDEIEAALDAGADYASVLAVLQSNGVNLTTSSFETVVGRVRKERRKKPR
jgi:hypothetical protein